jgi:hypothetical protein
MSKRKEKTTGIKPATTEITKVVATVADGIIVGPAAAPERTDASIDVDSNYTAAIEEVRGAFADFGRSTWRLAWALVDFREMHERLYPDDELTDKQLVSLMGIKLTHTRIGQLVNTARAFPRDQVDELIDFRVYEQARLLKPRITPEKRLKLVKDHPTTAEMAKVKPPAPGRTSPDQQELIVRVTSASGDDDKPGVSARWNRETVALPDELQAALRKHAIKLFAREKTAEE